MIPTTTLFTKTRNRWRHFMQLRSNPDYIHSDFEMFSRVWRSIESLCLTSGLWKNYAREVGIRVFLNIKLVRFFSFGAYLGEVNIEKSTITLKYATDADTIYNAIYEANSRHNICLKNCKGHRFCDISLLERQNFRIITSNTFKSIVLQ